MFTRRNVKRKSFRQSEDDTRTKTLHKELKSAGNGIYKGKGKIHFFLIFKCSKIELLKKTSIMCSQHI